MDTTRRNLTEGDACDDDDDGDGFVDTDDCGPFDQLGFNAGEQCNGLDDDCDAIDELADNLALTRRCANRVGVCRASTQEYLDGEWGDCRGAVFPSDEVCDGQDRTATSERRGLVQAG